MGASSISLWFVLRGAVHTRSERIGRGWLVLLGAAFAGAGIWVPDVVRGLDQRANVAPSVRGLLHGICGLVVILTSPVAFTLLRPGRWPTRMAWVGLSSLAASLVTLGVLRHWAGAVEPAATLVSVCNRFMILTYAAWIALAARREVVVSRDPLAQYQNIATLQQRSGKGPGVMARRCEHGASWLPRLDVALARLDMASRPSLRGLVDDLFSDDARRLFAAVVEVCSFDWLKQKGLLVERDVGFPSDWSGGDDPPFEGVLNVTGRSIPFDVKDGSGDGQRLLESILEGAAEAEAGRRGVAPPTVHVALDAPSGQKWVEDSFASLVRPFKADLAMNGVAPRIIRLTAGSGTVKVGVDQRVGGSVIGLEEKAAFVAEQILKHASDKALKLHRTTATEFTLIYAKLPGSGHSDFDTYTVETACGFLAARADLPASFVGLVFADMEAGGGQTTILWDRYYTLPPALRALADKVLHVAPRSSLEDRRARATRVSPGHIEAAMSLVGGSCDLRGEDCSARGTIGPVFVYFADGEQLLACQNCRIRFGWPPHTATK